MKFPTPFFKVLQHHFRTDPRSAHICTKGILSGDPSPPDTSATRMSEALCLACGLMTDRASVLTLPDRGDGKSANLGPYGYKADLCAHGMARGAVDLAHFLVEHWGQPHVMLHPNDKTAETPELTDKQGVIAFIDIDGERARGHIDLWYKTACQGAAFWKCRKAMFWRLD